MTLRDDKREALKQAKRAKRARQKELVHARKIAAGCGAGCAWEPYDCGCSWGCDHCTYRKQCRRCGDVQ